MSGLAFEGVVKRYGDVHALRGLTLSAEEGELLVLVGPSGCGKTTALRVAAGLERVDEGTIAIGSRDVTRVPAAKRNVSMVFQSYALFPHLTVAENIGFGLRARRVEKTAAGQRVREAAALVSVVHLLERKPFELSGGERQRVALARALARHPDVFLLDEPLSNLDAQLRVETRAELESLHRRLGATMLYVTHDQVEALTMGDRLAVVRDGAVEQLGTPEEVYNRPASRFVARFIGSPAMNVLPVTIRSNRLIAGPFSFAVRRGEEARIAARALELGIRPEHVLLAEEATGSPATVALVEMAGSESFLHLDAGGHRIVVRAAPHVRPRIGSEIRITARRASTHLFDAETGATVTGVEP